MPRPSGLPNSQLPYGSKSTWDAKLDKALLKEALDWSSGSHPNPTEQGKSLQDTVAWVLGHLPQFTVELANQYSMGSDQELDLLVSNRNPEFNNWGEYILIECKNEAHRLGSSSLAWFDWKMQLGGCTTGIFVAREGITRGGGDRFAASILLKAHSHREKRRILVISEADLRALNKTKDLVKLLRRREMALVAQKPFD